MPQKLSASTPVRLKFDLSSINSGIARHELGNAKDKNWFCLALRNAVKFRKQFGSISGAFWARFGIPVFEILQTEKFDIKLLPGKRNEFFGKKTSGDFCLSTRSQSSGFGLKRRCRVFQLFGPESWAHFPIEEKLNSAFFFYLSLFFS